MSYFVESWENEITNPEMEYIKMLIYSKCWLVVFV